MKIDCCREWLDIIDFFNNTIKKDKVFDYKLYLITFVHRLHL